MTARTTSASARAALGAWALQVGAAVAGASTVALTLAVAPGTPMWARAVGLACVAGVVLVSRPVLDRCLHAARRAPKIGDRLVAAADALPPQRALTRTYALQAVSALLQACAFTVLLHGLDPSTPLLRSVGAFAVAWLVGFLVIPLPAGAGLREVVVAALLGGAVPASTVVAASIAQRVVAVLAELGLTALAGLLVRRATGGIPAVAAEPDGAPPDGPVI